MLSAVQAGRGGAQHAPLARRPRSASEWGLDGLELEATRSYSAVHVAVGQESARG